MSKYKTVRKAVMGLSALGAAVCCALSVTVLTAEALLSPVTVDLIAQSESGDWFHNDNGEMTDFGIWEKTAEGITVDAYGGAYAMEGATYLTAKGQAYGAYEAEATFVISELNDVENPMIGIIPWYVDYENYLFVQLKFTNASKYFTTDEEREQGYALQEIIVSGRLDGEAKYNSATAQQENTVFDSNTVPAIAAAKRSPLSEQGHTIKVEAENSGSSGNFMKFSLSYNGVSVGNMSAYYYNKVAKTSAMGFMAQDVRATYTAASFTDGYAENRTPALARDWKNKNGYTYRTLNGFDAWTFQEDGGVSVKAAPTEDGKSSYTVTGSNYGGYNTNRGFTQNPVAEKDGLPQNYEVSAVFSVDELAVYTGREYKLGYGLIAWYKDDQNFVSATVRRTESGKQGFSTVKHEVVLYGWIEGSNLGVGTTVYALPSDFDETQEHTIRVEKKSVGFFVYLDGGENPIISKRIAGTDENFHYGYEGYNVNYSATKITARAIYSAYDEISSFDEAGKIWKNAGKSQTAWSFDGGKIALSAKETSAQQSARSYLLGSSDISDKNVTVTANVKASLGSGEQLSELLLSPYIVDEFNFVRAGLAWKDGAVYARIYACAFTEEDEEVGKEPAYTVKESEISSVDLANAFTLCVKKIGTAVGVEVNGTLVYGREIEGIAAVAEDIGIYAYNLDLTVNSFETEGYKKYTQEQVGDWITSGIKNNQWSVSSEGWLISDATYTEDMTPDDGDDDKNWALVENENADYTVTAKMRVTAESRAQDRVGLMVWYVDEENYLMFFMDRWRSDSAVARTTFTGLINGEYLPTRYNHGGWFPEGDKDLGDGTTATENSQLDKWHTVSVTKSGNTFTCSVDGSIGLLNYTVAAGLPSTEGKTVYSGIYVLNDAIEVSEWAITPAGGTVSVSTPALPSQATSVEEEKLELGTYSDRDYTDEFDKVTTNVKGDKPDDPDTPDNPDNPDNPDDPGTNSCGGCGGAISAGAGLGLLIPAMFVFKRKKSEKSDKNKEE